MTPKNFLGATLTTNRFRGWAKVTALVLVAGHALVLSRLIPLQEVLVILLGLDLVSCTESFHKVSLGSTRLHHRQEREELNMEKQRRTKTIIDMYMIQKGEHKHYSLFEYFHFKKNGIKRGNLQKDCKKVKYIML